MVLTLAPMKTGKTCLGFTSDVLPESSSGKARLIGLIGLIGDSSSPTSTPNQLSVLHPESTQA
jgi:hypothetical protein